MAVKDIFVWPLIARRILAIVRLRLLNNLTYLLTYLLRHLFLQFA